MRCVQACRYADRRVVCGHDMLSHTDNDQHEVVLVLGRVNAGVQKCVTRAPHLEPHQVHVSTWAP